MIDYIDSENERTFLCNDKIFADSMIEIEQTVNDFIKSDSRDIIFDMGNVIRLNSKSLAFLIRIKKKLEEDGRVMTISKPNETILNVIAVSGLDAFLLGK